MEIIGLFAAAGDDAKDFCAARRGGFQRFQHQRRRALGQHEAVAVLGEGLRGLVRRVVLGRQRRQQREADQRLGGGRAIGADAQRAVGLAAADRLDAELDGGRAGGAGRRQRDRQAACAEGVGEPVGDGAELRAFEQIAAVGGAGGGEQAVVAAALADGPVEAEPVLPAELDGRRGEEQRAAEIVRRRRPASAIASRAAVSASSWVSAPAPRSLDGRKSTVPAIVVLRCSTGSA